MINLHNGQWWDYSDLFFFFPMVSIINIYDFCNKKSFFKAHDDKLKVLKFLFSLRIKILRLEIKEKFILSYAPL